MERWIIDEKRHDAWVIRPEGDSTWVICELGYTGGDAERVARLIAAAPLLVEALRGLLRVCDEELDEKRTPEMAAAHSALSAALGTGE